MAMIALPSPETSSPGMGLPASSVGDTVRASKGSIALDQWRGFALILVLFQHGLFFTNRVGGLGRIGVNLFFFISGILVYRSLKKEQAKSSWQLATSFWWRRFRRLYPALIAYVIAMLVPVAILQRLPNLPSQSSLASYIHTLPFALTYSINYLNEGAAAMALVHLWSLSCEMQFYLVAPGIFILAGRDRRRQMLVFGGVALALGAVGLIYPMRGSQYLAIKYQFEIAAWPMAFGVFCEFAKSWFLGISRGVVRFIFAFGATALTVVVIVMLCGMEAKKLVIATGGMLLFPCLLSYLFGVTVPGVIGRWLAWCGARTYSIYLCQQPFTLCRYLAPMWEPLGAAASIIVGAGWFRIFELPVLSRSRTAHLVEVVHPEMDTAIKIG
jgi:peptidoglycan/LPS O-acetylase OafA/YrhL